MQYIHQLIRSKFEVIQHPPSLLQWSACRVMHRRPTLKTLNTSIMVSALQAEKLAYLLALIYIRVMIDHPSSMQCWGLSSQILATQGLTLAPTQRPLPNIPLRRFTPPKCEWRKRSQRSRTCVPNQVPALSNIEKMRLYSLDVYSLISAHSKLVNLIKDIVKQFHCVCVTWSSKCSKRCTASSPHEDNTLLRTQVHLLVSTLPSIRTVSSKVSNTVTKSSVELEAPELQKGSMRIQEKECIGYTVRTSTLGIPCKDLLCGDCTRSCVKQFVVVVARGYKGKNASRDKLHQTASYPLLAHQREDGFTAGRHHLALHMANPYKQSSAMMTERLQLVILKRHS